MATHRASRLITRAKIGVALAGWLGPWSDNGAAARDVQVSRWRLGETRLSVYSPQKRRRRARGYLFVCPGLHFAGADEPKMDRFLRALASAGIDTVCATPAGFHSLRLVEADLDGSRAAFNWAAARAGGRLGVMSISFGSRFAIELAADPRVGGLLCFGGYASWQAAMRFAVGLGDEPGERDPLNRPVVFGQVADHFGLDEGAVELVRTAWLHYCKRTWGRQPLKRAGRHVPVAREAANGLPLDLHELFLQGCAALGSKDDVGPSLTTAAPELSAAIDAAAPSHQWLDPSTAALRVTCPTWLVHGVDDDVIPVTQLEALALLLTNTQRLTVVRTGLYGHTAGAGGLAASAIAAELVGFARVLDGFGQIVTS